jgi:hypothetical protein
MQKINAKYLKSGCAIIMSNYYNEEKQNISEIVIYDEEMPSQIKNNPFLRKNEVYEI